jgi:virginiamycin B lyase
MKTFLTFLCSLLLVCPGFAKDKQPGDVKLTELLKKIDSQAMPDSYVGKNHQKWVDTRMAKLTEAQKDLHGQLWAAKRRMNPNKNVGQSFIKILHYVSRGEKLGRILTGDGYGQPQYSRHFVQLKGIKPGEKTHIHGRVTNAKGGPMEGVMVTAYDEELEMSASVFTGVDGKFELNELRKTTHQVRMRQPGKLDERVDEVEPDSDPLTVTMKPATGEKLQMQRTAASAMSLMKWDSLRDKENFKMMCTYCHQAGTVGFRTPEQPVDWETMVRRMDGFGGLYKHTQKTIVKQLLDTYTRDAESRWPKYIPPPPPTGFAAKVKISEWDIGIPLKANVHDLEPGPPGTMYAVDMGQGAIVELDIETGQRTVYRMPPGAHAPHSIEPDNDGNYWVTLCASGHMGKFDPKTTDITIWSSAEAPAKHGSYPHTLRVNPKDQEGLIWYTDAGRNSVFTIHPKTGYVKEYHLLEKNQAVAAGKGESRGLTPYGLDFAPDGSVWYSKLNANRIGRIDPKAPDENIKEWNPPFRGPRRHHVDQDGIVWVPGFGSGVLGRFDPKSEQWTTYALPDYDNQIPYALNIDAKGIVWICGTGNDTIGRFDPKTERLIEIPMPTRVTFTREIEFDEEGNIWTCSSNGPTRHNERGRGSLIRIELPKGEPAADEGVKLERIILSHHQVAHVRQVPWHKSPHGDLLKKIDAMPAPKGIPVNKTLDKHFKKRMAAFTDKQRRRFNTLRQGMDLVEHNMENRGLSYLKILEYIHHNEK